MRQSLVICGQRTSLCLFLCLVCVTSRPFILTPSKKLSEAYYFEYLTSLDEDENLSDSEVSPGLYEGDIAGLTTEMLVRLGLKWEVFPERKWSNATVPYVISSKYLPAEQQVIQTAISTLQFFTCIQFVPWDGTSEDYLHIYPVDYPRGCWSFVGKRGGQQLLSLQRPDAKSLRCLGTIGKPIHELLHALGLFHEQARPDRDQHVTIVNENIHESRLHNFNKQGDVNTTYLFPYDYDSVMHYGRTFFTTKRGRPTIVPKRKDASIGQRIMMSKGDCLKVNSLYGCLDGDRFESAKYEAFCDTLAL